MSRRRSRGLGSDERALWDKVAASARPMRPRRPAAPAPEPAVKCYPAPPKPVTADFRIGEIARPLAAVHDLVTPIKERPSTQPLRMGRRTHQQLTRGKLAPEARIDLHGMTLAEAHPALIRFVLSAHGAGKRLILVITGKGRRGEDRGPIPQRVGVLRHQVPHWLTQPPLGALVLQIAPAHLKHGGGGAWYVYLRRVR
jgi:DNA-nicking Smr family endonuclease